MNELKDLTLNIEKINNFCEHLEASKRQPETLKIYKSTLLGFYDYLPEDKRVTKELVMDWKDSLEAEYAATSSINLNISIINGFLKFSGRRDLQTDRVKHNKPPAAPRITRNEYLRLLQIAKLKNKERLYLIIKVFATMGLSPGELKDFTVEALHSGHFSVSGKEESYDLFIPYSLKKELNNYVQKMGISCGPIFCTRNGTPVDRNNILVEIRNLSREARVAPEKCNPRSLAKMYTATREEIENEMAILAERRYVSILESEQTVYGWDS